MHGLLPQSRPGWSGITGDRIRSFPIGCSLVCLQDTRLVLHANHCWDAASAKCRHWKIVGMLMNVEHCSIWGRTQLIYRYSWLILAYERCIGVHMSNMCQFDLKPCTFKVQCSFNVILQHWAVQQNTSSSPFILHWNKKMGIVKESQQGEQAVAGVGVCWWSFGQTPNWYN